MPGGLIVETCAAWAFDLESATLMLRGQGGIFAGSGELIRRAKGMPGEARE